jgi:hypothetical protein
LRLLLLNPNMTEAVTDVIAGTARCVAAPGTEIAPVTARRGLPYITARAEAQIGGSIALEMLAEHQGNVDAAHYCHIRRSGGPHGSRARQHGGLVMVHAEGHDAIKFLSEKLEREGRTAPRFHATSRPIPVEREATHRAIGFAELSKPKS